MIAISGQQQQNFDIVVQGQGATFAEPVYAEWLFAYTLLRPEVHLTDLSGYSCSSGLKKGESHLRTYGLICGY